MSEQVSDVIVSRLKAWGVRHIFGYTGDGINGVLEQIEKGQPDPVKQLQPAD